MEEMQELLSDMERSVIWIREIIRAGGSLAARPLVCKVGSPPDYAGGMSDEDEEAISRVIDQLIQCGLLIEGETTEGVVQLRCV